MSVSLQATKEMASATHFFLGTRPKWPAQAAPSQPCPSCGDTVVPPWRDKSLWRITATKTLESTKIMEEFCEPMRTKHAIEYAKVMKECEEVKDRNPESENEMKEEAEGEVQEWKE